MFIYLEVMVKMIFLCVIEVVYVFMIISFSELVCFMIRYLGGRVVILFLELILIWCKNVKRIFFFDRGFFFIR